MLGLTFLFIHQFPPPLVTTHGHIHSAFLQTQKHAYSLYSYTQAKIARIMDSSTETSTFTDTLESDTSLNLGSTFLPLVL